MIYAVWTGLLDVPSEPECSGTTVYFGSKKQVQWYIGETIRLVNNERRLEAEDKATQWECEIGPWDRAIKDDFLVFEYEVPRTKEGILRLLNRTS